VSDFRNGNERVTWTSTDFLIHALSAESRSETAEQFKFHITDDVLPPLLVKLSSEVPAL
jgi:hypothetical protein